MKGLTHFFSGVTLASFFGPAVASAAMPKSGNPDAASSFILVLGGIFGILPDFFDFKLGRFFAKEDVCIEFDPMDPDPADMARQIGEALDRAAGTGKYTRIQYNPMRLGSSLWRQYYIGYDPERSEVSVVINEIVNTSQVPFPGTAPPPEKRIGIYKLTQAKFLPSCRGSSVDIMSGPMMGYDPRQVDGECRIAVEFLPWHRTWSHSYVLGAMLASLVWLLAASLSWPHPWLYGLVSFLGFAIHITEDLTGHMGGSLIWPFQQKRYDGFCMFKASDPRSNFTVIYACLVILIFNLDRLTHVAKPVIPLPWYSYFFWFGAVPLVIYHAIYAAFAGSMTKEGVIRAESALAEFNRARNEEAQMEEASEIG